MSVLVDHFGVFAGGFWLTLQLCVLAGIGALLIGTVVAVARIAPAPPLRWLGTAYVMVFRNLPLTVVFFFTVFGLPSLGVRGDFLKIPILDLAFPRLAVELSYFRFAIIALSCYTGAFVCEALRSGINAVDPGQSEAGRAIGLGFLQNLRHIVLPQAWKAAIVPLGSVIIAMIKNSALAGFFGLTGDLSQAGTELVSVQGFGAVPVFIGIATGFLIMTMPLGLMLDRVEARRASAR